MYLCDISYMRATLQSCFFSAQSDGGKDHRAKKKKTTSNNPPAAQQDNIGCTSFTSRKNTGASHGTSEAQLIQ